MQALRMMVHASQMHAITFRYHILAPYTIVTQLTHDVHVCMPTLSRRGRRTQGI